VFSVAQTFLSAVSQGFPACMGSTVATTKLTLVESADRMSATRQTGMSALQKARAVNTYCGGEGWGEEVISPQIRD